MHICRVVARVPACLLVHLPQFTVQSGHTALSLLRPAFPVAFSRSGRKEWLLPYLDRGPLLGELLLLTVTRFTRRPPMPTGLHLSLSHAPGLAPRSENCRNVVRASSFWCLSGRRNDLW